MPTFVLHTLNRRSEALASELPIYARVVRKVGSQGTYTYWYTRLERLLHVALSPNIDLASVPDQWLAHSAHTPTLLAREAVFAIDGVEKLPSAGMTNLSASFACVLDPNLIQDNSMDPTKVLHLGDGLVDVFDRHNR